VPPLPVVSEVAGAPLLQVRDGAGVREVALCSARVAELRGLLPWRTFRSHRGQRHYSGLYWSATTGEHVIYESRLELARLLFADMDPSVGHIVAQPFRMVTVIDGALRTHVPDFLLLGGDGGVCVVDVKPRRQLDKPEVAFTLGWARRLVTERGWGFEVWSEPDGVVLANMRWLAGYRRGWLIDPQLLRETDAAARDGTTIGQVERELAARWPVPLVRGAVGHLLWSGTISTDLTTPLSSMHVLGRAA
jgi:hypothetical protein